MKHILLAGLIFASPAFAETFFPWEGTWAFDLGACAKTADEGGDTFPFTLTATEVQSLTEPCEIKGVAQVPGMQAWSYTMSCAMDGEVVDEPHLVMMDGPDAFWQWFGSDEPLRFQRCPK